MNNLIVYLRELEDPRDSRGLKHELTNIIVMSIYGILCGNTDCESIAYFLELRKEYFIKMLNLENGVPSADTLLRVFSIINPEKFMEIFSKWVNDIVKQKASNMDGIKVIPIDGKAVRAATEKIKGGNIPYIVSAFMSDLGISIGQVKVDAKSNEITAIPKLLDLIDIKGSVVTIDAIGTQIEIVEKIVKKEGHYCLAVKENQKELYKEIKEYFEYVLTDKVEKREKAKYTQHDKGHGRIEKRESYVITDIEMLSSCKRWKNVKSIGMTRNYREINGEESIQEKYYISDIELSPKELTEITRKHWSIENNLHWVLDMYFKEDLSTNRKENAVHNFSLIRKICYNLIKLDDSVKRKEINKRMMYYNYNLDNLKRLIFEIYPSTH